MEQFEFEGIIDSIAHGANNIWLLENHDSVTKLHKLVMSAEIRDLIWPSHLYDTLWQCMTSVWKFLSHRKDNNEDSLSVLRFELLMWDVLYTISKFPEFDFSLAFSKMIVTTEVVEMILQRSLVCFGEPLNVIKQCLHWIYTNRMDLRSIIRLRITDTLLTQGVAIGRSLGKSGGRDGGRGRDHVSPLLEVIGSIIKGMESFQQPDQFNIAHNLLTKLLLPLHRPNEMIEWRDQIPVLQLYHQKLMDCIFVIIDKSRIIESSDDPNNILSSTTLSTNLSTNDQPSSSSLWLIAICGLLSTHIYPQASNANTPKEILLLHEIELLLEMATFHDFQQLLMVTAVTDSGEIIQSSLSVMNKPSKHGLNLLKKGVFLNRLCSCLKGETENFRTMQCALLFFRNEKILSLFSTTFQQENDMMNSTSLSSSSSPSLLPSTLSLDYEYSMVNHIYAALLPALYRNGKLSWNPTVNKMTGLALRALNTLHPTAFEKHAEKVTSGIVLPTDGGYFTFADLPTFVLFKTNYVLDHFTPTIKLKLV